MDLYNYLSQLLPQKQPQFIQFLHESLIHSNAKSTQDIIYELSPFISLPTESLPKIQALLTPSSTHISQRLPNPIIISQIFDPSPSNQQFKSKNVNTNDTIEISQKIQNLKSNKMVQKKPEKQKLNEIKFVIDRSARIKQDIHVQNLILNIGGKDLLYETDLHIVWGKKYGLIGKNGIGKSCLMNYLCGLQCGMQVLLVEQEITLDLEKTAFELVLECDIERKQLIEQLNSENQNNDDINEIMDQLNNINYDQTENKVKNILQGLGFKSNMHLKLKQLSGGWQMRVNIARALFVDPDVLLLDEPTNHLDLDAVLWLEQYIQESKNTIIVVSHARQFINIVSQEIIEFKNQKLKYFKGNYENYEKQVEIQLKNQKKEYEKNQSQMKHIQQFIDKFRYNAKRASLVQSRIKKLNKMDIVEEIVNDPYQIFIFLDPNPIDNILIKIENGFFHYDGQDSLLQNINFYIQNNSRLAIVGSNGVGKSTFLKILMEKIELSNGIQWNNPKLRISYFSQHHQESLDLELTPLEQFEKDYPNLGQETYRSHFSNFGLIGSLLLKPIYLLSGGQKSRVSMAIIAFTNPHLFIMDEPTNHLDIEAVTSLIAGLNSYKGALIIVSHDEYFISHLCDQIYYIQDKQIRFFNGDFEKYRAYLNNN